jgi:hypothetical protein
MVERWHHRPLNEGEPLTPAFVRDQMIECFFASQKEILEMAARSVRHAADEAEIRRSVCQIIKMAFAEAGGDYEAPTKEVLMKVMDILKRKSRATGKEAEVIQHHAGEMMDLVGKLR